MDEETLAESNIYHLAALDVGKVPALRSEHDGSRVWFYFERKKAEKILNDFENGVLKGPYRDFAASLERTKDRVFSIDRERKLRYGNFVPQR